GADVVLAGDDYMNPPAIAAFEDGSCILELEAAPDTYPPTPRSVTLAAGEPNETTISLPLKPQWLLARLRGEATNLSAPTPSGNPAPAAQRNIGGGAKSGLQLPSARFTPPAPTTAIAYSAPLTQPLAANFHFATTPVWYEIHTDASHVAPITVAIRYDEN